MILLINSNKVNLLINDELGTSLARSDSLLELIEKTDFDTRKNNLYYYYGKYNTCSHNDKPTLEKIFLFAKECESWYPDIIAAQAQLESNSGTSDVFKHTNNLFGMRVVHNREPHAQLNNDYKGYGSYNNWYVSIIDRIMLDFNYFDSKPSRSEYESLLNSYAEDENYKIKMNKIIKNK